jgi:hypothetical protein
MNLLQHKHPGMQRSLRPQLRRTVLLTMCVGLAFTLRTLAEELPLTVVVNHGRTRVTPIPKNGPEVRVERSAGVVGEADRVSFRAVIKPLRHIRMRMVTSLVMVTTRFLRLQASIRAREVALGSRLPTAVAGGVDLELTQSLSTTMRSLVLVTIPTRILDKSHHHCRMLSFHLCMIRFSTACL